VIDVFVVVMHMAEILAILMVRQTMAALALSFLAI
jgi:hypothetical protein